MSKYFKRAIVAVSVLGASTAMAQQNLTSNTAGAGTTVGLTATALVEYANDRGIANIQLKDGQTGTNYIQALGEGKIDIANGQW
jgi:ABC-type nitrate/sulfonate/bicarbonate transport system substrate-binding protein